ncbi:MAG: hypothetical protein H6704_31205 [Myxococcales bacterium]|nr:hypothetical protein [Myxococcales bacterium]
MRAHLTLIALTLLACGGPPPPDPAARYPSARYIVAEGHGATPGAAAQDARARVAAAVRSRLKATLEVRITEGGADAQEHIVTEVDFARAELIEVHPLDCAEGECRALGVLSRGEAVDALIADYERLAPRFREAAGAATARAPDDLAGFTADLRTAEASWEQLRPLAWQIEVVGRGAWPPGARDLATRRALEADRARRLSALTLAVTPPGLDPALDERVQTSLVGALVALGFNAVPAAACGPAWHARPNAAVGCDRSALGPRCRLALSVDVGPCDAPRVATIEFSEARLVAIHPRAEKDARAALAARLPPEAFTDTLRVGLRPALPLP